MNNQYKEKLTFTSPALDCLKDRRSKNYRHWLICSSKMPDKSGNGKGVALFGLLQISYIKYLLMHPRLNPGVLFCTFSLSENRLPKDLL